MTPAEKRWLKSKRRYRDAYRMWVAGKTLEEIAEIIGKFDGSGPIKIKTAEQYVWRGEILTNHDCYPPHPTKTYAICNGTLYKFKAGKFKVVR